MDRNTKAFWIALPIAVLMALFSDGDWWVMGLAGWAICDIVRTFLPQPTESRLTDEAAP